MSLSPLFFFLDNVDAAEVIDGHKEDVGEFYFMAFEFVKDTFTVPAEGCQTMLENVAVDDADVSDAGFGNGERQVVGGDGLFGGTWEDGEFSVGFEDDVINVGKVGVTFLAKFGEKLFDFHAVFAHFVLHEFSATDEKGRTSVKKTFKEIAFYKKEGNEEFECEEKENGGDGVRKRGGWIGDGGGGDLREHECDDEFGDLDFADLTFAHDADGKNEDEIDDGGAYEYGKHRVSMVG